MKPCGIHNCVRLQGHAGAHCVAPSARTLDWDLDRSKQRADTATLDALDFPSPPWADLNDEAT